MAEVRSIRQSGIVELSDGTKWLIPIPEVTRVRTWNTQAQITLSENGPSRQWKFIITNEENGQQVAAARATFWRYRSKTKNAPTLDGNQRRGTLRQKMRPAGASKQ
jgi:hypothetical protein